jgi:hypothetical protein
MTDKKQTNEGYVPIKKGYVPNATPGKSSGHAQDGYTPTKSSTPVKPPPKKP